MPVDESEFDLDLVIQPGELGAAKASRKVGARLALRLAAFINGSSAVRHRRASISYEVCAGGAVLNEKGRSCGALVKPGT